MLTPLLPLVWDNWIELDAHSLLGVVGLRAEDSVTGHGRLRLLPREEVSSPSSCGWVLDDGRRSREKNENMFSISAYQPTAGKLDIGRDDEMPGTG